MNNKMIENRLRIWPGVLIVIFQWLITFGIGIVAPATMIQGLGLMFGPPAGLLLLFLWWGFFSRATSREKISGILLSLIVMVAAAVIAHPSMMPMMVFVYGIPTLCLAFVLGAGLTRRRPSPSRLSAVAALLVLTGAAWSMVRAEGIDGDMSAEFAWRWKQTAEERLLASTPELPAGPPAAGPPVAGPPAAGPPAGAGAEIGDIVDSADSASANGGADTETLADATNSLDASVSNDASVSDTVQSVAGTQDAIDIADVDDPRLAVNPVLVIEKPEAPVWPGFRGAHRDGVVPSLRIATDWNVSPPEELWRRPVGPGWGSFAIAGDLLYTQEQRGDDEIVSAYRADSGEPVWMHRDPVRFWEALAGAGPRATPMIHDGKLYSLGATGLLVALDATTGSLLWSRDAAKDTGAATPEWGFSASPLVIDGLVVIHTGGPGGKGVVAYDVDSGEPRWFAPASKFSYCSVHLATLDGVRQLLLLTETGAMSYAIADGAVLWQHDWLLANGARIVQPAVTDDGGVLIGTGFGLGLRRIDVSLNGDRWQVAEKWTTTRMKPYYNDLVVHEGYAYGFDGRILAAINLETGERAWKGGRYGNGQMVLLPEQDLMVVLSDRGDVALVSATPSGFSELAKIPAIKGKTWNHPVVANGVLYVRNGEEMVAYRLPAQSKVASLQ